ncbi:hypothetical protein BC936DRAFT_139170 [Jimgerdemannia flammicorona]|uniref:RING-CH-type domain-containing protein n=1 Tax=Jimgerdemannia flammicorona TaxID=994334 RepID=A0A433DHX8_9FUNG|nr:hypothetical protein BC936DRAFT_139170 [Jimgerdemannia flammicorona]
METTLPTTVATSTSTSTSRRTTATADGLRRRQLRRGDPSSSSTVTDDEKEDDGEEEDPFGDDDDNDEQAWVDISNSNFSVAERDLATTPDLIPGPPIYHRPHKHKHPDSFIVASRTGATDSDSTALSTPYDADDEATSVPASPLASPEHGVDTDVEIMGASPVTEEIETDEHGSSASARAGVDERFCRICFSGPDDEDESLGRLISPCLCSGTMKYVHIGCLNRWRGASQKKTSFFECDSCKYRYRFSRTTWAAWATNEFVLTLVTITIFALAVFLSGFLVKFLLWYLAPDPEDWLYLFTAVHNGNDDNLTPPSPPALMTLGRLFTLDLEHALLGLSFVGIIGFIQIMFGLLWLGPFPWGGTWNLRNTLGIARDRDGRGVSGTFLLIVIVLGCVKACWSLYKAVKSFSRVIMERLQDAILEVNPE